jgi:hypothetical protein
MCEEAVMISNCQLRHLHAYLLRIVMVVSVALLGHGCAQQPAMPTQPTSATPWALATSTMQWNDFACELIARNQIGQFPALRTLAYLNLAIHDAIVGARQKKPAVRRSGCGRGGDGSRTAFPKDEQVIATRLAGETAAIGAPHRASFTVGVETGRAAASEVMNVCEQRSGGRELVRRSAGGRRQVVEPASAVRGRRSAHTSDRSGRSS